METCSAAEAICRAYYRSLPLTMGQGMALERWLQLAWPLHVYSPVKTAPHHTPTPPLATSLDPCRRQLRPSPVAAPHRPPPHNALPRIVMELLRTWEKNRATRISWFLCCRIWEGSPLVHFLPSHGSGRGSGRGRVGRTDLVLRDQADVERGGGIAGVERGHGLAPHEHEAPILQPGVHMETQWTKKFISILWRYIQSWVMHEKMRNPLIFQKMRNPFRVCGRFNLTLGADSACAS